MWGKKAHIFYQLCWAQESTKLWIIMINEPICKCKTYRTINGIFRQNQKYSCKFSLEKQFNQEMWTI